MGSSGQMTVWQRLVHVCQRWRQIIYASPRYLDLHLYCSYQTPFRKNLSRWPEFPLIIDYIIPDDDDDDDLIAALEHSDRVHRIDLIRTNPEVEEVVAAMEVPFPVLTHFKLTGSEDDGRRMPYLPDGFLGGSAPCLQHLRLEAIAFDNLPKLLLSARDLVSLQLDYIPVAGYGYISPKAMVEGLAGLTKLRTLCIRFPSPIPSRRSRERRPDSPMCAVLPSLTQFEFGGESEYLENFVAQIDTPRVEDIRIEYFKQEVQAGQLSQFIGRTENLKLAQFRRAHVTLDFNIAFIELDRPQGECHQARLSLTVSDPELEIFPVPGMAHVLGQLVAMLSNVGHLFVHGDHEDFGREEDTDEWLPLLRLFPAVEALRVSGGLEGDIASVLEDIAEEMVTEVLPALHLLWLVDNSEPVGSTERFLSLRQLSGRPVTIVNTQDEFVE